MTEVERRTRLARRHGLAGESTCPDPVEVARAVVGLHASDPASVYLGIWARAPDLGRGQIETALYDDRSLVRVLGMRRTMFVVPTEDMPLLDVGCARPLAAAERRRTQNMLADAGITDRPADWVAEAEAATLQALKNEGPAYATELTQRVPQLGTQILVGEGTKWAGRVGMSTRILFLLATAGQIVRTRPRGTWLSSQYRWDLTESWLGTYDPDLSSERVRTELVRRYLRRFGPATETDVAWWTGWTKAATRQALADVGAVEVDLGERRGFVLGDDTALTETVGRWVALLPGLDSTVMGWKERDWYLGPHAPSLFDRNGNAGPTVWVDGRIVGAWAQRPDGQVVWELVERVDSVADDLIHQKSSGLSAWFEGTVVKVRFPSPFHRQLANS